MAMPSIHGQGMPRMQPVTQVHGAMHTFHVLTMMSYVLAGIALLPTGRGLPVAVLSPVPAKVWKYKLQPHAAYVCVCVCVLIAFCTIYTYVWFCYSGASIRSTSPDVCPSVA